MIKKKQYMFLSFYLTRSLFFGGALSLLVGISKNNLLITSFLGMILGYFLLYLFYRKGSINKVSIGMIGILAVFIMILCNTILTSNFLLYETPSIVVMIVFLCPLIYSVNKEFSTTPRIGELCFPVSILVSLFAFIALPYLVHLDNLFPMFNTGVYDFIKGIVIFAVTSLFPNILLINYKGDLSFKDINKGYLLGSIVVIITMFYILSIYGYEFASIVRFPEYLILKKIDVFNYVSNVENIFVLEWLCSLIISSLLCIKVLYDNLNKKLFVLLVSIIVIILGFVLTGNYVFTYYIKISYYYFILGILLFSLLTKKGKSVD